MADDADEQLYTLITLIVDVQWFRAFQKVDDAASRQQGKMVQRVKTNALYTVQ